jgi:hypothetical protein
MIRWRQGLAYGQGKKRDKGGRGEGVEVRAGHGKAHLEHVIYLLGDKQINTSVVERHNGTSRLRNQRKVRNRQEGDSFAPLKVTKYDHQWVEAALSRIPLFFNTFWEAIKKFGYQTTMIFARHNSVKQLPSS